MYVVKRDGRQETVHFDKITARLKKLSYGLSVDHCDPVLVSQKVCAGVYKGVTTTQLDELAAETAAAMTANHPDYASGHIAFPLVLDLSLFSPSSIGLNIEKNDMSQYLNPEASSRNHGGMYRLVTVVEHFGMTGSGHYTVYRSVRVASQEEEDCEELRWFSISDSEVGRVSESDVLATTLTGLHFGTTTLLTTFLTWLGYIQPSQLPWPDLLKFVLFANFSIVGMNVSLMWNSVGFYQIAKLSMIPVSCLLEVVLDNVRYSRDTKLSILLVLAGVAVCTVTDVSVNLNGFLAAAIAVWSTALQQYYVHYLQRKYSLGSFNLLAHTAPVQAASLLLVGPFLDYWLTNQRVDAFNFSFISLFFLILSCSIAVGTNLSQFICIGRFTAVSFQVLGHMKTILVLVLGFTFFGKEGLNMQVVLGMLIAILGMIWYGNASSKPGGKERRSLSIPITKAQKLNVLSETSESDGKV
ncbi:hypothetical protein F2Q70_00012839 [Brassica cretica]|uniref:ATP-cone domain-containing protein n=1 Tax=Brassica cretica TaxID=69181 RepID=A0A8S9M0E9_BRACR|nr:hypothetical protein F2Q70_00012839 [Brassica cretica]